MPPRLCLLATLTALAFPVWTPVAASAATRDAYRLSATARLDGATLLVRASLRRASVTHALARATVRVGELVARTDDAGRARFTLPSVPRHAITVTVAKGRFHVLTLTVRPRVSNG